VACHAEQSADKTLHQNPADSRVTERGADIASYATDTDTHRDGTL
jgi:hypothetical protein